MKRALITAPLVAALAITAAGCGGSKASAPPARTATTPTAAGDPSVALDRSVREALRANYRLSAYVLWHNDIPAYAPQSTRGPALSGLRSAAAQRRSRGIRIRPVEGRLRIVTVTIDPSFLRATAVTQADGRVRPYRNGRALGRTIPVHERARVELRRLGRSHQFVVWQVTVIR